MENLINKSCVKYSLLMYLFENVIFNFLLQDSRDNMSIVLVTFPGAPTPTAEAIQKEKQLEDVIERRIKSKPYMQGYFHKFIFFFNLFIFLLNFYY